MNALESCGLVLVDKPKGPTSHDIVERIRRACRVARAGHAGTLDPLASGLLPIVVGRATRLVRFLPQGPKVYRGSLRLGISTTTDDLGGEVVFRADAARVPAAAAVATAARELLGRKPQVPPAYSARKIGGVRMYRLARQGRDVRAPPRDVEIQRFDLTPTEQPDRYEFEAEVSAGTYIRALARDLGQMLGCGGVLEELVRTGIGPLTIEDAVGLPEDLEPGWLASRLIPLEAMRLSLPDVRLLNDQEALRFSLGAAVRSSGHLQGLVRVLLPCGMLAGIGDQSGDWLLPRVVLLARTGPELQLGG